MLLRLRHETGLSLMLLRLRHETGWSLMLLRLGHETGLSLMLLRLRHETGSSLKLLVYFTVSRHFCYVRHIGILILVSISAISSGVGTS